ncbi:MAG: hypothetical protein ACJ76G_17490 [Solirubrobacterales bacterium]
MQQALPRSPGHDLGQHDGHDELGALAVQPEEVLRERRHEGPVGRTQDLEADRLPKGTPGLEEVLLGVLVGDEVHGQDGLVQLGGVGERAQRRRVEPTDRHDAQGRIARVRLDVGHGRGHLEPVEGGRAAHVAVVAADDEGQRHERGHQHHDQPGALGELRARLDEQAIAERNAPTALAT